MVFEKKFGGGGGRKKSTGDGCMYLRETTSDINFARCQSTQDFTFSTIWRVDRSVRSSKCTGGPESRRADGCRRVNGMVGAEGVILVEIFKAGRVATVIEGGGAK